MYIRFELLNIREGMNVRRQKRPDGHNRHVDRVDFLSYRHYLIDKIFTCQC